ncbi:Crp/Fnr family transcriptional regulator [Spirosoma arcticum]
MNPIASHLEKFQPLTDADRAFVAEVAVRHDYPKHYLLMRAGEVCNYLYFVADGRARNFYYKDGRDVTTWFGTNGMFLTDLDSLINRQPSRFNIETLEPTGVYSVHHEKLAQLFERSHALERAGRLSTLDNFVILENRLFALQFHTAQERYTNFLRMFPGLINRVPLTHIASYLGITLETLSRVRANLIHVK